MSSKKTLKIHTEQKPLSNLERQATIIIMDMGAHIETIMMILVRGNTRATLVHLKSARRL